MAGLVGFLTVTQAMILFMVPSVLGIVLILRRLRRQDWKAALKRLLRSPGLKAAFANAGMIVYVVLCLCLSVLALL